MIEALELVRVRVPLRAPFRSAVHVEVERDVLLVRVVVGGQEGWGECVVPSEPHYSSEYVDGAADVLVRHLVPALRSAEPPVATAEAVGPALARVRGHRMAKAALETAVLDAELHTAERSLAAHLGGTRARVPAGVSVGIPEGLDALLAEVGSYVDEGYRRVKLKVQPGWDVRPVRAVRDAFGDGLPLQVDANTAYRREDLGALQALDDLGLLLVEQPLEEDDLLGHVWLAARLRTPVCLDESITSVSTAASALELGACSVVNVKPGRVGGYLEARRIHDLCAAAGVPVWCGGMVETGVGRSANLALASLPGFTLTGDLSASARFFERDLTAPVVLTGDGEIEVPTGPGAGLSPDRDVLAELGATTTRC